MSVKLRILIPMVIISIVAATVILFINIIQFSNLVGNYIEDELDRAILKVIDEIDKMKTESRTAMLYYANDDELIDAMDSADGEAVLKRTSELFAQTNVESLTIVDSEAIVLARGHEPGLYGDDTSDMPIVVSALAGEQTLGIERGVSTKLSVRSLCPLYNKQGRLLGALFVGNRMDTNEFVDRLKKFTGCEITVFIDDVRVATTLHGNDGTRAVLSYEEGYTEAALASGEGVPRYIGFQNQRIVSRYTTVHNGGGELIGIITAEIFLEEKQQLAKSFIMTGTFISAAFILFSILVNLFISGKIAAPIDRRIGLVNYDKLTGIYSRHYFDERLNLLLKNISRFGGVISLLMIDIDYFKKYNDTYGHIKGDYCLREVAGIISKSVARADDFAARYGGEEFVAVLPYTDEVGAKTVAERLIKAMRERAIPHERSEAEGYVTLSIGITTGRVSGALKSVDLIRQADFALYESKRNGRNRYTVFTIH